MQPEVVAEAWLGTRFARLARVPTGCEPACAAAMAEGGLLSEARKPRDAGTRLNNYSLTSKIFPALTLLLI